MIVDCGSQISIRVIAFDHRKRVLPQIPSKEDCPKNLTFHVNLEKSSSSAAYDYFSAQLAGIKFANVSWIVNAFHLQFWYREMVY